jgi:hypothetical protein
MKEREPGCKCHWEEGDSPCPVHGDDDERVGNDRVYRRTGYSEQFEEWLDVVKQSGAHVIVLVTDNVGRHFFEGYIHASLTRGGVVTIVESRQRESLRIVPRRDIAGWFDGAPDDMSRMRLALAAQGWAAHSAPWG